MHGPEFSRNKHQVPATVNVSTSNISGVQYFSICSEKSSRASRPQWICSYCKKPGQGHLRSTIFGHIDGDTQLLSSGISMRSSPFRTLHSIMEYVVNTKIFEHFEKRPVVEGLRTSEIQFVLQSALEIVKSGFADC